MREFGQLGVVAKKHHALQLVAELVNDDEQVIRLAGIQPIIYHDILELVIELLGDDLRRRERASPDSTGSNRAAHRASPIAYPSSAHRSGPRCARAARVAGAPDRAVRRRARTLAAGRTAARAAHFAQELPSSPRQTGVNLILRDQLHRHWVGLPDIRAVLTNRTVGGEFARTGRVQDRHACPALA